jgi:hypothetical protein
MLQLACMRTCLRSYITTKNPHNEALHMPQQHKQSKVMHLNTVQLSATHSRASRRYIHTLCL